MKYFILAFLIFVSDRCFCQKKGFEFLSFAKSSLESVISDYAATIPDTSAVFKKYYIALARNYNKAKASYDGYRGAMKGCILDNNSKNKIVKCLQSKTVDIQGNLDTLETVLESAYFEESSIQSKPGNNPGYSGKNSGLITTSFISSFFDSLVNGAIKLWDQSQKYKKQFRDDYLNNITSKDYDLSELDDLLKKKPLVSSNK